MQSEKVDDEKLKLWEKISPIIDQSDDRKKLEDEIKNMKKTFIR